MSLLAAFKRPGPSGFGYASTAEQVTEGLDLTGKRILITGCNSGLGFEAMRVLTLRGATVIGAARTLDKAKEAGAKVQGATEAVACELSEPASVRAAVATVLQGAPLDAILCNAGIMALPNLTLQHGYEAQFFTNHVGHFLLVTGLLDHLTDAGRVVMLSSSGHTAAPKGGIAFDNLDGSQGYSAITAYGQSKLANLLFARELARRFEGTQKVALGVHPGVISTNLGRYMNPVLQTIFKAAGPFFLKTEAQGAATEVWATVHPDAAAHNGAYLADCNVAKSSAAGRDAALAKKLWEVTEALVAEL